MIEIMDNGIRKITLGEGTTYISQCIPPDADMSSGILFSSKPPLPKGTIAESRFQGDEVIIEITNFQGAMSYMKGIVELLKTWKIEGMEEEFNDLLDTLDVLIKK